MNCPLEVNPVSEERMEIFVNAEDGSVLTGKRRTGTERLLDDLYKFLIKRFPERHIVAIKGRDDVDVIIKNFLPKDSIVLIYSVFDFPDWDLKIKENATSNVTVYCGQELCHQVPACFKSVIAEYK